MAFRSKDDGYTWDFAGWVLDAASVPSSQEGPNENDITLLKDGKTIMCVCRLDAGDGTVSHPYVPYVKLFSSDQGSTWSAPVSMGQGIGCARPRLMRMDSGSIILSGGRTGPTNRDILLWVNKAGDGKRNIVALLCLS